MPYQYYGEFNDQKPYVHRFTLEEDELAKKIAKAYMNKGYSEERANQIGYATVNKIKVGGKSFRI